MALIFQTIHFLYTSYTCTPACKTRHCPVGESQALSHPATLVPRLRQAGATKAPAPSVWRLPDGALPLCTTPRRFPSTCSEAHPANPAPALAAAQHVSTPPPQLLSQIEPALPPLLIPTRLKPCQFKKKKFHEGFYISFVLLLSPIISSSRSIIPNAQLLRRPRL